MKSTALGRGPQGEAVTEEEGSGSIWHWGGNRAGKGRERSGHREVRPAQRADPGTSAPTALKALGYWKSGGKPSDPGKPPRVAEAWLEML